MTQAEFFFESGQADLPTAAWASALSGAGEMGERQHPYDLLMQVPANIAVLRGKSYQIELATPLMLNMWDKTSEQVLGKPFFEVFPEEREGYEPILAGVFTTGIPSVGTEIPIPCDRNGDGLREDAYFSFVYTPLRGAANRIEGIIGFGYEVTEQVSARREAQASEAHLAEELADMQQLHHISGQLIQEDQISVLYQQVLDAAITLMHADMGSLQMLVPERNELLLLTSRGFDPASAAFWQWVSVDSTSVCGVALRTGERVLVFDVESGEFQASSDDMRAFRLSGIRAVQSTPLVSRRGRIVGMFSTQWCRPHRPSERELRLLDVLARQAADLIERRQAEEALRESEERFRTLADHMSQLAWITDATGAIVWYNQRWYDYTGTREAAMSGRGWHSVCHPDHVQRVEEKMRHCFQTGEEWEDTFPLRGHDGTYRWFLSRAVPIRGTDGQVLRWFGTNTDITEQRRLEQQKDEFLGVASHELKTPITSLKAYAQLLERRFRQSGDARSADLLGNMDEQLNKLTGLVNELLDVTRIESGQVLVHFSPVEMNALISQVVEEVQRAAPQHRIVQELASSVTLSGDRERIGQVLINLLTNAIKYSPQAETVLVKTTQASEALIISVQDFGIGIAKEKQAHLFERFYRVEGESQLTYPGLGLGLYIAAEFVRRHQGSIWIESEPGRGTTVSFALPVDKRPREISQN